MAQSSSFLFDIEEARNTFESFLNEDMGTSVLVDNVETRALVTDLEKIYNNIQQSSKNLQLKYGVKISRGSVVEFVDKDLLSGEIYGEKKGIVYTVPDVNAIYTICDIVLCNATPEVFSFNEEYDEDLLSPTYGDRKNGSLISIDNPIGFMELANVARHEKDYGIDEETKLLFTTSSKYYHFNKEDIFKYKGYFYEVLVIDEITDGLISVQLRNAKVNYEQFINQI